jgi:hypothetical protein
VTQYTIAQFSSAAHAAGAAFQTESFALECNRPDRYGRLILGVLRNAVTGTLSTAHQHVDTLTSLLSPATARSAPGLYF